MFIGIILRMDFIVALFILVLSLFQNIPSGITKEANVVTNVVLNAEVVRVIDGDTIVVRIDGKEATVRYIGIDTPEPYRDGEPACFSLEASQKNKELVAGKTVRLESDQGNTDRYDRLLRYVYVDETFVNAELVKEGYARSMKIKPNTNHATEFLRLESTAREERKGLWENCQ